MRTMDTTARWTRVAGLAAGFAALSVTLACNSTPGVQGVAAQHLQPGPAAAPVVVGCEPHQRALVRQTLVNGAAVSQVECVAAEASHAAVQTFAPAPAAAPVSAPQPVAARPAAPVYAEYPDAAVVPARSPAPRAVQTRQVIYDERPVRKTRSVGKSAIIIGSSAGAGAGVGAAIGGKKGALIGAAVGGGGAAVWDQITRRK